jgi:tRNA threonylcarbamoyladenosine modification (KEOPS) complex  Pcc1 subunit
MQPTARILIERVADALDESVLPALSHDKWSASTVRSAVTLLRHLAKRVELEAAILAADTEDAQAVLNGLLHHIRRSQDAELKTEIDAILADPAPASFGTPAMDAHNTRYQDLFERLLRDQYDGNWTNAQAQPVRGAIRAYLKRRLARERDMYMPEFSGPPF